MMLNSRQDVASGPQYQELNITSCSGPKLNGDSVLSHASTYCIHLISVDISWTGATDNGIKALVQACRRYFDVSGCKKVTDTGVQAIAMTCHHLQYLDLSSTQIGKRGEEQVATLYQNINLTEPRLVHHYEQVIMNFIREIKLQNSEMENLALAVKRAQDKAAMQLSEMEEEMDHRIQAAENKIRQAEAKKAEAALGDLKRQYDSEVCELQVKMKKLKMVEEQYKHINLKDEVVGLKRKINELTLENQQLKRELLGSQTNIAFLQSELDSLKCEYADQSLNLEQDKAMIKGYTDERDNLARQIGILQSSHSSYMDEDCDMLAMCDPMRRADNRDFKYPNSEKAYKVVLAGDAAVGKSSFLLRLCKNEFRGNTSATLGVDFQMKTLVVDGEPTVLQLWDTAGQERFRSIAKSYFRRADGVLLLYDVTCEKSFLNIREWVDMIEDVSQGEIPIMLVGNKADLREQAIEEGIKCIPTSYGEKLAMVSLSYHLPDITLHSGQIYEGLGELYAILNKASLFFHYLTETSKDCELVKGLYTVNVLQYTYNLLLTNEISVQYPIFPVRFGPV
ncbi:Ras and EF-hand domain-containing protein [Acipenser ruthenus]|uniref:Ras and EF-hand domain-containing protein n=1 Tax=Acipenser ruthenus TaxID=7906 RepID=A0A662YQR0_ACIRT|nr:Ras and EF-hand domain-containing protein [Acipenser ruthenus]